MDPSGSLVVDEGKTPRVEFVYYCADQCCYFLRKAQMTLAGKESRSVPRQGYVDLIKASWILIDVIARHPQLNLLDSVVRCEVELLAEVGSRKSQKSQKSLIHVR